LSKLAETRRKVVSAGIILTGGGFAPKPAETVFGGYNPCWWRLCAEKTKLAEDFCDMKLTF